MALFHFIWPLLKSHLSKEALPEIHTLHLCLSSCLALAIEILCTIYLLSIIEWKHNGTDFASTLVLE
jgi:hypothetical protein